MPGWLMLVPVAPVLPIVPVPPLVLGAGGVGEAGSLAGAGLVDIVPSLVVPIGGAVVSVPCVVDVPELPVEGVVVGVVDWAMAAVPRSSAAENTSDFIDFTPLRHAGGGACAWGQCMKRRWVSSQGLSRRTGLPRSEATLGVQRIAGRPHCADDIGITAFIDRLAQPPDMDVHGPGFDIAVMAPDAVEQSLA